MAKNEEKYDLLDPEDFGRALINCLGQGTTTTVHGLYCSACRRVARVNVRCVESRARGLTVVPTSIYGLTCAECLAEFVAVLYKGPRGPVVGVFSSIDTGISTPNTPKAVAHYLDQAGKCEWASALSAAVAMYRSALEHLLHEQGYGKGMLDAKIRELEAAVAAGTAPKWATDMDTEFLDIIKKLGNGAIHTNGGDISKQDHIDEQLLTDVRETLLWLLEEVYEAPARKAAAKLRMKEKGEKLKADPST